MAISVGDLQASLSLDDSFSAKMGQAADAASAAGKRIADSVQSTTERAGSDVSGFGDTISTFGQTATDAFNNPITAIGDLTSALGGDLIDALSGLGAAGAGAAGALGILAGGVAAVTGVVFGLADSAAKSGEAVLDFSRMTGIAVENVGPLEFAAKAAGGSLEGLQTALRMIDMKSATDTSGKFAAALKDIGVNADAFNHMDNESKLMAIAQGFQQGAKSGNTMADAMALMGRQGASNLPVLLELNDKLLATGAALGVQWSQENVEAAKQFNLALNTVEAALGAIGTKIGIAVLPALSKMLTQLASSPAFMADVVGATNALAHGLGYIVQAAGDVVGALGFLITQTIGLDAKFAALDVRTGKWAVDTLTYLSKIPGAGTLAAVGIAAIEVPLVQAEADQKSLDAAYNTSKATFGAFFGAANTVATALENVNVQVGKSTGMNAALNKEIDEGAGKISASQKAIDAYKAKMAELSDKIGAAMAAGESMDAITEQLGKQVHTAADEASLFGLKLSDLPSNVVDVNASFNTLVIATAIAKANEQMLKLGTNLADVRAKAAEAAADKSWKAMAQDISDAVTLSDQWNAAFTSATDQAIAKANVFAATWKEKVQTAFDQGKISAADYFAEIAEIDELQQKMISDAHFQEWETGLSQIGSEITTIGGLIPGTFGQMVKSMGDAISQAGNLVKSLQDVHDATSLLGSIAGITGVIGAIVGIGKAIAGFFGIGQTAGRDLVVQFAQTEGGFDALHTKLDAMGPAGEQMWVMLTQGVGSNNPAQAQAAINKVTQALDSMSQSEQNVNALLGETPDDQLKNLQADITKYNVSINQLGPAWKQQNLTVEAQGLMQSYTDLTSAGVSVVDTVKDMSGVTVDATGAVTGFSGGLNQLLNDAITTGAALPDQFKPVLQALIDSGDAVDATGHKITSLAGVQFSSTLDEQFQTLIDKITSLVNALTQNLTPALDAINGKTVTAQVNVDTNYNSSGQAPTDSNGAPLFVPPDGGGGGAPGTPLVGVGDAPVTAVSEEGAYWLKPGDVYGMPRLTPGFGAMSTPAVMPVASNPSGSGTVGGSNEVHFHFDGITVQGIDGPSIERAATTLATTVVGKIQASGALQTALVNRGILPVLRQQGVTVAGV